LTELIAFLVDTLHSIYLTSKYGIMRAMRIKGGSERKKDIRDEWCFT